MNHETVCKFRYFGIPKFCGIHNFSNWNIWKIFHWIKKQFANPDISGSRKIRNVFIFLIISTLSSVILNGFKQILSCSSKTLNINVEMKEKNVDYMCRLLHCELLYWTTARKPWTPNQRLRICLAINYQHLKVMMQQSGLGRANDTQQIKDRARDRQR